MEVALVEVALGQQLLAALGQVGSQERPTQAVAVVAGLMLDLGQYP